MKAQTAILRSIFETALKGVHDLLITIGLPAEMAGYLMFALFLSFFGIVIFGFIKYGILNRPKNID